MKTMKFNTLLKLAAAIGFLGLPAVALATPPAAPGSSLAAGLADTYEEAAASPEKAPRLPRLALDSGGYSEDKLVKNEEGATRVKRTSRLQEPGEAMGGGEERRAAAAKKAAGEDKE
ncbi:MAG: hypothetical protein A2X31_04470 [Elusimicrobia bacterium GWB2_63_22]|nr:MAG: hypothetical protein A2X31_04470 [Elusimicrobia bacterium GWB2_63_22]